MTNILEIYNKDKQLKTQKPKKKQVRNCKDCVFAWFYDREFDYEVIDKCCYCRRWDIVVKLGRAKHCPYFERSGGVN